MSEHEFEVDAYYTDAPMSLACDAVAPDLFSALVFAASDGAWVDSSGRPTGFILVWKDGECIATFFSQAEARSPVAYTIARELERASIEEGC